MAREPVGPADQVIRIDARWGYTAFSEGKSSWHFYFTAAVPEPQIDALLWWQSLLENHYVAGRPDSWRLDSLTAVDVWPGNRPEVFVDVRHDADPPGDGPGLPPQISPLISWRSAVNGRANRGRTYMGPYCVDSVEESNVVGPAAAATSAFAESMMLNFNGLLAPLFGIYSRWEDGVPISPGVFVPMTTYYFFERWAVVRRRLDYDWRTFS